MPEISADPDQGRIPPVRRRRILVGLAAAIMVAAAVAWMTLRDTAPVGRFTSAQGYDEFFTAYNRAMAQLPPPSATLDLRTDYGIVRMYRFDGADPTAAPLVLLPGRAAGAPMWADNLTSLLALRTVYLVDLLGEPGASVQSRPIEHDADQAAWLHQALTQLPDGKVVLVGVSIGGWTATNLALRQPDKIAGVVTLDPVMTFAPMSGQAIVRSIPASVRWLPKSFRDGFNSWVAGGAPVEQVPVADMIEAGMKNYALALPTPSTFDDAELRELETPFLVIMAGESVMHDSGEAADHARRTLPHATVHVYDDASHAINGEYPDRIAADIAEFLTFIEA